MTVLIVSINEEDINRALRLRFGAWQRYRVEFRPTSFDLRMTGVWQEWLATADLFLIGLERRYSWGLRAEGVMVADSLLKQGKRVLVMSGEFHSQKLGLWFYWDLASELQITQAIHQCLELPFPRAKERKKLVEFFSERLKTDGGH